MNYLYPLFFTFIAYFGSQICAFAQNVTIKRSAISASGSLHRGTSGKLMINQIVGQTSLIGIQNVSNVQVSQGFLQPVGIQLVTDGSWDLSIYPNPSKGEVFLQWNDVTLGSLEVMVYNTDGKLVRSTNRAHSPLSLELGMLAKGMYYIQSTIDNGQINTQKLILK